jgi:hypothetical protein
MPLTDDTLDLFQNLVTGQAIAKNELDRLNSEFKRVYERITEIVVEDEKRRNEAKTEREKQATKAKEEEVERLDNRLFPINSSINNIENRLATLEKKSAELDQQITVWKAQIAVLMGLVGLFGVGTIYSLFAATSKPAPSKAVIDRLQPSLAAPHASEGIEYSMRQKPFFLPWRSEVSKIEPPQIFLEYFHPKKL